MGLLEKWQCGISHTLAWICGELKRIANPSHKQARQGVAILEIAKQHEAGNQRGAS